VELRGKKVKVKVKVKVKMFKSFKEMPVWISSMDLAESIFYLTENLPKKEDYGFTLLSNLVN